MPPSVCVTLALDEHRTLHGGSSRTPRQPRALLDHVARPFARARATERVLVHAVPRAPARPARDRLDEVGLRPRDLALEPLLAVLSDDPRELPVELRQRDEVRLVDRSRRASRARRTRRARRRSRRRVRAQDRGRRPRSTGSRGWAARARARAARGSRRCTERAALRDGVRPRSKRRTESSPITRTRASVRPRVSKRLPIVRGLPVSCSSTGAPSDSSHSIASSSCSTTTC